MRGLFMLTPVKNTRSKIVQERFSALVIWAIETSVRTKKEDFMLCKNNL